MLLSFIVYTLLALVLWALGFHVNRREERLMTDGGKALPWWNWEMLACMAIITLFMGLRYETGSDYGMYMRQYLAIQDGSDTRKDFEVGFYVITYLLGKIRMAYPIYFGFWGLLQAFFLYYGLRNNKKLLPWVPLFLILGPYLLSFLTFMRQWTVSLAFLCLIPLIQRRKFWLYAVLIVALATIHKAALLLLLMYFVPLFFKGDRSWNFYFAIFVVCIVIGIYPVWLQAFKWMLAVIDFVGYEKYINHVFDAFHGQIRGITWGPQHVLGVATELVFIVYYPKVRDYFSGDKLLPLYFGIAMIGVCYEQLVMNTDVTMLRPAEFTAIINVVLLAYTASFLFKTKRWWQLGGVLAVTCCYTYLCLLKMVFHVGVQSPQMLVHFIPF